MKAYFLDLRERVMSAVDRGDLSRQQVAEIFRLIFIDESAIDTDLVLRYGRVPKGERPKGRSRAIRHRRIPLLEHWLLNGPLQR